jgi:hypothetical protein
MSETEVQPEAPPAPEPTPQAVPDSERVRYEDNPANFPQEEGFEPAPLSAEEVPLESQRKDETSVLATDRFNEEGERVVE